MRFSNEQAIDEVERAVKPHWGDPTATAKRELTPTGNALVVDTVQLLDDVEALSLACSGIFTC